MRKSNRPLRPSQPAVHTVAMLKVFSKKTKKLVTKRTSSHKGDTDSQADTLNGSEQEATVADVWARPATPENSVHKIVIGVDFGTTYTGA